MYITNLQVGGFAFGLFLLLFCISKLRKAWLTRQAAASNNDNDACLAAARNLGSNNYHAWNKRLAAMDSNNRRLLLIDHNLHPVQECLVHISTIENVMLIESREQGSNYLEKIGLQLTIADGGIITFRLYDNAHDHVSDLPRLTRFATYFKRYLTRQVKKYKASVNDNIYMESIDGLPEKIEEKGIA